MSRSRRRSDCWLRIEPVVKQERRNLAKQERRAIKTQLASGSDDPFFAVITPHTEYKLPVSWYGLEATRK